MSPPRTRVLGPTVCLIGAGLAFGCATSRSSTGADAGANADAGAAAVAATRTPLAVGTPVPDVSAKDQAGAVRRLMDERGHPVVVFFYPKDATPGCTREACGFRDSWDRYQAAGIQVFGVSGDDVASKAKFAKDQNLPFPILADPEHAWSTFFGVPVKNGMVSRVTFLIDKEGKVAKVYPNVDPGAHAAEVLKDAAALEAAAQPAAEPPAK